MIIIACAELLHVFIHFFIGHEIEANSDFSYLNFKSLIIVEVLLTLGLAGVLYYEGEVSSMIAIIQGLLILTQVTKCTRIHCSH